VTDVFSAALDDLFADPNLARDALWRAGGADPAVPMRVIVRRPDRIGEFGETRIVAGSTVFEIRIAEAPTLAEGDTIEVDGELHVVQGEPMRDAVCLVWTAEARPA
jgi:hypothetical protein